MDKFSELKETPTPPLTPTRKRNIKRIGDKSPIIKHVERYIFEKKIEQNIDSKKEEGIRLPELILDNI
tara:strand:+ start:525 stop:728 length:204 start_codon:yes stop_codon:yes gene_type:complete